MPNVMATQPNICGALCESFVIPLLAPRQKVWLMATDRVTCSNAANIGERKTWTQSECCSWKNSIRGQEPQKMYTQCTSPGDGQRTCKVLLASAERHRCSNEAKTRSPLKFAGVPKLPSGSQPLVGRSLPYSGDAWRRYCCLMRFFPIVNTCLSCEDIARQSCAMVPRWRFLGDFLHPVIFSEPRATHFRHRHTFYFCTNNTSCAEAW